MAYPNQSVSPPSQGGQQDVFTGEQYRYALYNFGVAHKKVEEQRQQLEAQDRLVAQLKARIQLLEGGGKTEGRSVDDFAIKVAASKLEKSINRWAAAIVQAPPEPPSAIGRGILSDLGQPLDDNVQVEVNAMQLQSLLRHAMSEAISEGIVNTLIVTNSGEANVQLTRVHEHLFARDPTVACVWRRQTFSAAIDSCTPEMLQTILIDTVPTLAKLLNPSRTSPLPASAGTAILESAHKFSRMLHETNSNSADAFYRAFVPELQSTLNPKHIELVTRCRMSDMGGSDRVGATIFPGLVKVTKGASAAETVQTVMRRAQVICECSMTGGVQAVANGYPE